MEDWKEKLLIIQMLTSNEIMGGLRLSHHGEWRISTNWQRLGSLGALQSLGVFSDTPEGAVISWWSDMLDAMKSPGFLICASPGAYTINQRLQLPCVIWSEEEQSFQRISTEDAYLNSPFAEDFRRWQREATQEK